MSLPVIMSDSTKVYKTEAEFRKVNKFHYPKKIPITTKVKDAFKTYDYTNRLTITFGSFVLSLKSYTWRDSLSDLISGIVLGLVRIPQAMANALLAGVAVQYGLYTELFSCLFYSLFATSRHNSMGTSSVTSLLLREIVLDQFPTSGKFRSDISNTTEGLNMYHPTTRYNMSVLENEIYNNPDRIMYVTAFTSLVGVYHILFGIFQLHRLSLFLPDTVVTSFTTALAFHTTTSQLRPLFGIPAPYIPRQTGIGGMFITWYNILKHLPYANVSSVVISVITFIVCCPAHYVTKRFKIQLKGFPIPGELIMLIVLLIFCFYWEGADVIEQVGHIPPGIEAPRSPNLSLWYGQAVDALIVAIISYFTALSLGRTFSFNSAVHYAIEPMQEAIAMGLGNALGSFFNIIPAMPSLSRSAIQFESGAKTQVCSLWSCAIVLTALYAVGSIFSVMPKALLASIIIINQRSMFTQFSILRKIWEASPLDGLVWLASFLIGCIFGILPGLLAAIILQLAAQLVRLVYVGTARLTLIDGLYKNDLYYDRLDESAPKIYQVSESFNYLSTEMIIASLPLVNELVLDFCHVNYIDYFGAITIKTKFESYDMVALCNVRTHLVDELQQYDIVKKGKIMIFPTIADGVEYITERRKKMNIENQGPIGRLLSNESSHTSIISKALPNQD